MPSPLPRVHDVDDADDHPCGDDADGDAAPLRATCGASHERDVAGACSCNHELGDAVVLADELWRDCDGVRLALCGALRVVSSLHDGGEICGACASSFWNDRVSPHGVFFVVNGVFVFASSGFPQRPLPWRGAGARDVVCGALLPRFSRPYEPVENARICPFLCGGCRLASLLLAVCWPEASFELRGSAQVSVFAFAASSFSSRLREERRLFVGTPRDPVRDFSRLP